MIFIDIVLVDGVVIEKVLQDQVLHYVKYLTGSIGSSRGSSSSGSSGSRRHGLIRRRTHSKSNRG